MGTLSRFVCLYSTTCPHPHAGAAATVETYRKKLGELKIIGEPMFYRVAEIAARPQLLNDTLSFLNSSRGLVALWETTSPQVRVILLLHCFLVLRVLM